MLLSFHHRKLFFDTSAQTLYGICNSILSGIDCVCHLDPFFLLLEYLAVGRPHRHSKVWRIFGQTHSVHGTPRLTRGFLLTKKRLPLRKPLQTFMNDYSITSVTTPEPTVLPPSLIANLSPSSIAIGVISSISMTTLSPGMHISVPSGRLRSPVTSVVLK